MKILPRLKIGKLSPKYPLIQGGMAIRISTGNLAGNVAKEGGIGIIAASGMTTEELRREIRLARSIANGGIIGVNTLVAATEFMKLMETAVDEGVDLLVAGAGFSKDLFALGKKANIPVVPIVSSVRLAQLAESLGASAIIVEGKEAGGHLGTTKSSRVLYPTIKASVKIPVILAGGVIDKEDIIEVFKMQVDGVQMGTRFAASVESNASDSFKELYVKAKEGDVQIIHSPVGLPGNALPTPFLTKINNAEVTIEKCIKCLKKCSKKFCIINALIEAKNGNLDKGLVFAGEKVYKIKQILPVKQIINELFDDLDFID